MTNKAIPKPARTRRVEIGRAAIGRGAPVAVQSMTKTRTDDVRATVRQIRQLERAGCELVRLAVPDDAAASAFREIRKLTDSPLVADIHFDYRLALASIEAGADKVRINPGNIGARWKVKEIIRAAGDHGAAIRVGVNAGSLGKAALKKYGRPAVPAMLAGVEQCLVPFQQLGFKSIVLSAKTTSGQDTIGVYRGLSRRYRYPLHLGLTEAGLPFEGAVRSAGVLGVLLAQGIGDTVRISLTGSPVLEVRAAYELLACLGLRRHGPIVFSCPTCGRTEIDVAGLARQVQRALAGIERPLTVAVMGCVVNGPGEAREADFGIAGGKGKGTIFAHGRVLKTCRTDRLVPELIEEIAKNDEFRMKAGTPKSEARRRT